jgi:hypothetical protein
MLVIFVIGFNFPRLKSLVYQFPQLKDPNLRLV